MPALPPFPGQSVARRVAEFGARSPLVLLAVAAWMLGVLPPLTLHAEETPGLVQQRPAAGRFVETAQGYMVAYETTIPGTTVRFEMVPIPAGTFRLGSPEGEPHRESVEGPQIEVEVPAFWMASREVTWAEYKQFMALYDVFRAFESQQIRQVRESSSVDVITAPSNLYDPSFTFRNGEDPQLPAVSMSQYSAKQYTKWLSKLTGQFYRLPTESEWEYACRAGSTTAYHFGNSPEELGQYAWFKGNSEKTSHRVGLKKPNPWGLFDMHGNVSEWTLDELYEDGYTRFAGQGRRKAAEIVAWPKKLFPRVCRGGNWTLDVSQCRSASRLGSSDDAWREEDPNVPLSPWWFTSGESLGVGMRIIRPLVVPPAKQQQQFWEADLEQIEDDVKYRIQEEGRGARGFVDPALPEAIKRLGS